MKILYFSPFSYIRDFVFPEASSIKALIENGHTVTRLTCDMTFNHYCTSMKSISLDPESSNEIKKGICKKCILNSKSISRVEGLETLYTSSFISTNEMQKIDKYIDSLVNDKFSLESSFNSVNLNYFAMYEVILRFKLDSTLKLTEYQFNYFKNELRNCYRAYTISQNFKKKYKNEILFLFSPQYSILNSFYHGYSSGKVKTYLIEGSNNNFYKNNILRLYDWDKNKLVSPTKKKWKYYSNSNLLEKREGLKIVEKHIKYMFLAKSQFVYSKRKSKIRFNKPFAIGNYKKTALLNMSSNDEAFAAHIIGAFPDSKYNSNIFKNQIDWILYTINYFDKLKDYFLIIRIHPREVANKRERVISKHWKELTDVLNNGDLPDNVIINWPQDQVSFYDLINDVDILIANSSITVVESLYHNVPVVTYDNTLTNYPDEMVYSGESRSDYNENILKAFNAPKKDLRTLAIKWWIYTHFTSNLILANSFSQRIIFKIIKKIILYVGIDLLTKTINNLELSFSNLDSQSKFNLNNVISNKYESILDIEIKNKKIKK